MSSNFNKGNKNMKKQILTSHGVVVLILVGCGGGSGEHPPLLCIRSH